MEDSSSSTSTSEQHHHYIRAPPPSPSSNLATASPFAADAFSRLLHPLPPSLTLPTGRLAPPPATCPPTIPLSINKYQLDHHLILSASSHHGFFQLTSHDIPSQLANSAESESLSLFSLFKEQKQSCFLKNWPLGFNDENENDLSFWFDGSITCNPSTNELSGLSLSSLRGLSLALEKLGLEVVETISRGVGFDNPFKEDPTRLCSMMVVHGYCSGGDGRSNGYKDRADVGVPDRGCFYPYVVGLQYQIRSQKYSVFSDSGWATILPQVDSMLVTIGDIAQVWSNGKLKKVRGRPVPCLGSDGNNNSSHCVSMTLLITLPLDSTVSPLLPNPESTGEEMNENNCKEDGERQGINCAIVKEEKRVFSSFPFEDYAWTVYNEPFLSKDPLNRYPV